MNHNKHHRHEQNPERTYVDAFQHTYVTIRRNLHLAKHATGKGGITSTEDRQMFSRSSRQFADSLPDNDPRSVSANIFAQLPDYMHAITTLPDRRNPDHRDRKISKETREQEVEKTIKYNNVLRDIINHNQNLTPRTLLKTVSAVAMRYGYSDKERELVIDRTKGDLKGMQHELAFESVLYYLPEGFEIIDTDNQDDARGADYMVRCPNGTVVSIDVKATQRLQDEAQERKAYHASRFNQTMPSNEIILYSGFTQSDFDTQSPWRPTQDAVMSVLPHVESELLRASGDAQYHAKTLVE